MNIFITGISGFIGKKLAEFISFDKDFDKIYCLSRHNLELPSNFTVINGSLSDLDSLPPIQADVCIHLAALTNSKSQDDEVLKSNVDGTDSVIKFCKKSGIKRIVFLSTINVYLSRKYQYAQSKLIAERLVVESGLEYSILRSSLVYGEGCDSFDKIIKFIKSFHIVPVVGNGTAYEQPIYIDEVCKYIIDCAKQKNTHIICDLFGKTKMRYNDMIRGIANVIGERTFIMHLPLAPTIYIAEFCAKNNLPFPVQPEQIFHMCEDLCNTEDETSPPEDYELDNFTDNLKKYLH